MMNPYDPYMHLYANPRGAGDQRPTALKIVQDGQHLGNLMDKVILVTGGTGGIGEEIVRALYQTGAQIYITARDLEKAKKVCEGIQDEDRKIGVIEMDMESLDSVKYGVAEFQKRSEKLNILINNAGKCSTGHLYHIVLD